MSLTNETRHIKWHEKCKCICGLDGSICNSKQRCNENKCRCECKLIKEYVKKDIFGIQVIVNANAINLAILVNI